MKASDKPETAPHESIPIRTTFSHNKVLFISPADVDVHRNWRWILRQKTQPFNPVFVGVDSTGWYIVFEDSPAGLAHMQQCSTVLQDKVLDGRTVVFSHLTDIAMEFSSEYVYSSMSIASAGHG